MITLNDIQSALRRIRSSIYLSPCARSETFSESTANNVYLKLDNLQRTGAFKERGALNKLLSLTPEERAQGVIAASAGNHAQGVAYHAGKLGVRAQICMPLTTPLIKVSATRGYGADVILHGANYDEAYDESLRRSRDEHLALVHAFDDDAVIAGQGTIGLELLEQHPDLEAVVVPIGGGGLIGGIACALKESNPKIQVFGVQPSRLPSMKVAVAEGKPVTLVAASTIADGIAVRRAGERTLPLVQKYVDDIVTVEEEEIANAILLLLEREKTLAEGAGAAAVAALVIANCLWSERMLPYSYVAETSMSPCSPASSSAASSKTDVSCASAFICPTIPVLSIASRQFWPSIAPTSSRRTTTALTTAWASARPPSKLPWKPAAPTTSPKSSQHWAQQDTTGKSALSFRRGPKFVWGETFLSARLNQTHPSFKLLPEPFQLVLHLF